MKRIEKEIKKKEDPSSIYDVLPSIPFKATAFFRFPCKSCMQGEYSRESEPRTYIDIRLRSTSRTTG